MASPFRSAVSTRINQSTKKRLEDYSSITGKSANVDAILTEWLDTFGAGQIDHAIGKMRGLSQHMHEPNDAGACAIDCPACSNAVIDYVN
jgi:hypothetical protein